MISNTIVSDKIKAVLPDRIEGEWQYYYFSYSFNQQKAVGWRVLSNLSKQTVTLSGVV
jgi:hypothetical protein